MAAFRRVDATKTKRLLYLWLQSYRLRRQETYDDWFPYWTRFRAATASVLGIFRRSTNLKVIFPAPFWFFGVIRDPINQESSTIYPLYLTISLITVVSTQSGMSSTTFHFLPSATTVKEFSGELVRRAYIWWDSRNVPHVDALRFSINLRLRTSLRDALFSTNNIARSNRSIAFSLWFGSLLATLCLLNHHRFVRARFLWPLQQLQSLFSIKSIYRRNDHETMKSTSVMQHQLLYCRQEHLLFLPTSTTIWFNAHGLKQKSSGCTGDGTHVCITHRWFLFSIDSCGCAVAM